MTSGYRVPCSRKSTLPIRFASSWNTWMKLAPIIFLFFSGSVTPSNSERNWSEASTKWRLMPMESLRRRTTSVDSFFLKHPLSTMIAWKRLPIALHFNNKHYHTLYRVQTDGNGLRGLPVHEYCCHRAVDSSRHRPDDIVVWPHQLPHLAKKNRWDTVNYRSSGTWQARSCIWH